MFGVLKFKFEPSNGYIWAAQWPRTRPNRRFGVVLTGLEASRAIIYERHVKYK
jgi:hypothetical protein